MASNILGNIAITLLFVSGVIGFIGEGKNKDSLHWLCGLIFLLGFFLLVLTVVLL